MARDEMSEAALVGLLTAIIALPAGGITAWAAMRKASAESQASLAAESLRWTQEFRAEKQELLARLDKTEARVRELEGRIDTLEQERRDLATRIATLEHERDTAVAEVAMLRKENAELRTEVGRLREEVEGK